MGKHAQLLQQEDVVVLSAVLHEARAAALASSTSTADGDVELSLLEVGELEHTCSSMNSPRPSCDLRLGEPPRGWRADQAVRSTSAQVLRAYETVLPTHGKSVREDSHYYRLVLAAASLPPPPR